MGALLDEKDLHKLIVIGDRILIKPKIPQSKTKSGLLLPPGVNENEKVQIGYVLKVGPGYHGRIDLMNQSTFLFSQRRVIRLYICKIALLKSNSIRKNILWFPTQPYCFCCEMTDYSDEIFEYYSV
jgi:hypothetical protein